MTAQRSGDREDGDGGLRAEHDGRRRCGQGQNVDRLVVVERRGDEVKGAHLDGENLGGPEARSVVETDLLVTRRVRFRAAADRERNHQQQPEPFGEVVHHLIAQAQRNGGAQGDPCGARSVLERQPRCLGGGFHGIATAPPSLEKGYARPDGRAQWLGRSPPSRFSPASC